MPIEEAFATLPPDDLQGYIQSTPKKTIKSHVYGRNQNIFHAAITNPHSAYAIKSAHELGANINHQDADKRTPLHHVIDADISEAAKALIAHGARTDIENEAGYSPYRFCKYVLENQPTHASCLIINGKL